MALRVEVAGIGVCQSSAPYALFIVCMQQENFEAWTVYRRYNSFLLLREQLVSLYPSLPAIPPIDQQNLQLDYLESCRVMLDKWLQFVASNGNVLRMQSMYQFLCIDANIPPPYLEIHWRNFPSPPQQALGTAAAAAAAEMTAGAAAGGGGIDEMDMDEMFHAHHDAEEGDEEEDDEEEEEEEEDAEYAATAAVDAPPLEPEPMQMSMSCSRTEDSQAIVFGFAAVAAAHSATASGAVAGEGKPPTGKKRRQNPKKGAATTTAAGGKKSAMDEEDDENDEQAIKSIQEIKAEFLYNKVDDAVASALQQNGAAARRTISLDTFKIIKVVGKGSFGKVFLVRDKSNGVLYAMKVLKKEYIIRKNQVEHTKTERSVLGYVHHPYIVGLNMAFQTPEKLFLVLDYCPGGELFFHLGQVGRFPEARAKFYAAQIILALEYVHKMDVIYRDLKPENVLLDQYGNVRLTDFGLSKEGVSDHSTGANSFCGTPEYIAPEVLLRQGHGRAVDWWSLGALLYEMITGLPPFYSRNRETMFEKIMKAQLNLPPQVSLEAQDLLSKMLVRDPKQRLGSGDRDAMDIKEHAFFRDVDWAALATGKVQPPWVPNVAGSLDTSQFDSEFTNMQPIVSPDVRGAYFGSLDKAFEGFTFVDDSAARFMARRLDGSSNSSSCSNNSNNSKSIKSGAASSSIAPSIT